MLHCMDHEVSLANRESNHSEKHCKLSYCIQTCVKIQKCHHQVSYHQWILGSFCQFGLFELVELHVVDAEFVVVMIMSGLNCAKHKLKYPCSNALLSQLNLQLNHQLV